MICIFFIPLGVNFCIFVLFDAQRTREYASFAQNTKSESVTRRG